MSELSTILSMFGVHFPPRIPDEIVYITLEEFYAEFPDILEAKQKVPGVYPGTVKVTAPVEKIHAAQRAMHTLHTIRKCRKQGIKLPWGPNDKCPCKSGAKFKKCCGGKL